MLLAIDIGNTNVSLGVYEAENLIAQWRLKTFSDKTSDEIGVVIRQMFSLAAIEYKKIDAVIVSSVVPQLDFTFQKMSVKYLKREAIFVDSSFNFGLKIKYEPVSSVGIDRVIAASAAVHKYGKPCIVCDFGTATTIDAVNSRGEYLGGAIAPGIGVLADALFQKTSKLPRVEIKKPAKVIGNSTADSINSGIYFGYVGLVENIVRETIEELGEKPKTIATGGFANLLADGSKTIETIIETIDETLLLDGLRFVYEKNFAVKTFKDSFK